MPKVPTCCIPVFFVHFPLASCVSHVPRPNGLSTYRMTCKAWSEIENSRRIKNGIISTVHALPRLSTCIANLAGHCQQHQQLTNDLVNLSYISCPSHLLRMALPRGNCHHAWHTYMHLGCATAITFGLRQSSRN
jgi:hypothetical protein